MSTPATQEDMKVIVEKLGAIEQKIGSKWTLPIVVAIVSGLIGMLTVAIQVRLEANSAYRSKVREQQMLEASEARKEKREFHKQIGALTREVRKLYKIQCSGSATSDEQDINAVLEKIWDVTEDHRSRISDAYIDEVQGYSTFVADALFEAHKCVEDDEPRFQNVSAALRKFYENECQAKPEAEIRSFFGL